MVYGDIDNLNTINDLEALPDEENPEFADDDAEDRSYTTSDDSTCNEDHEINNDIQYDEEAQFNHFNPNLIQAIN